MNQVYDQDYNLFLTKEEKTSYIVQVSLLPPTPLPHSSSIKPINSFRKCIPK